jgi:nitrogenase molybdenum-iron protein alpha chain
LRGLGKIVGKEAEVEAYLSEAQEKYEPQLEALRAKLKGRTVVLGMGPGFAHDYVRVLTAELGMEVLWATSWHFDQKHDHGSSPASARYLQEKGIDVPTSVCDLQGFEMMNLLNKLRPDIYVSRHGGTAGWAAKIGIPSIMVADEYSIFGYRGTVTFGQRIVDTLSNRSRERNMANWLKLPYTDWWFKQESFKSLEEGLE